MREWASERVDGTQKGRREVRRVVGVGVGVRVPSESVSCICLSTFLVICQSQLVCNEKPSKRRGKKKESRVEEKKATRQKNTHTPHGQQKTTDSCMRVAAAGDLPADGEWKTVPPQTLASGIYMFQFVRVFITAGLLLSLQIM